MLNLQISKSRNINKISITLFCIVIFLCLFSIIMNQTIREKRVRLGNEIFVSRYISELRGQRVGLVVNHTSLLPEGRHLVDSLVEKGVAVASLFTTEHGFLGNKEAGQNIKDSQYKGIRIYSLHGDIKQPTTQQIKDLDVLVYDIQDVGARFYTYIATMKYILEAASLENIPVYILDRPNPTGGLIIEGPLLDRELVSFTGPCPIPIRYGMTCGELALMMKGENWIPKHTDIRVVKMKGWRRKYFWKDTGLNWIPPSPNIPLPKTTLAFPGTSLLGGIGINHGIGTQNPFLQLGAPWLDPEIILQNMREKAVRGAMLSQITYTPRSLPGKTAYPPYKDRLCRGVLISIQEETAFRSLEFTLDLIRVLKSHFPDKIKIITDRIDSLFGNDRLRLYIEDRLSYEELKELIKKDEGTFLQQRKPYLLY